MKTNAQWNDKSKIFEVHISGVVNSSEVMNWELKILNEFSRMKKDEKFFFLYDSTNYGFDTIQTHKYYREIIPGILIQYGCRLSFISDAEFNAMHNKEKGESRVCIGVALVHHDAEKMKIYDTTYGSDTERYFNDIDKARKWIDNKVSESTIVD